MREWLEEVKAEAQKMTYGDLMKGIDVLDGKVAKNDREAKAIDLMKKIYEYELQKRLWECQ